jgi:serine/threonine-protein kinase
VHRDIKPANVFVCRIADEVDVIKVLDFGLVRGAVGADGESALTLPLAPAAGSGYVTHAEGMVGTPAFMAPEQVQAKPLDGRADLYALGGVAFWLLTGTLVFERDNAVDQLLAHVHDPLPDLRPLLPAAAPDELVRLITACLEKRPDARPESARALGRALRAIVFSEEHTFQREHAEEWWAAHRPPHSEPPPALPPRELAIGPTVSDTRP